MQVAPCENLTSDSTRRLTSHAIGHMAAPGLHPSREQQPDVYVDVEAPDHSERGVRKVLGGVQVPPTSARTCGRP